MTITKTRLNITREKGVDMKNLHILAFIFALALILSFCHSSSQKGESSPQNPLLGEWYIYKLKGTNGTLSEFPQNMQLKITYYDTYFTIANDTTKYYYTYRQNHDSIFLQYSSNGKPYEELITNIDSVTICSEYNSARISSKQWMNKFSPFTGYSLPIRPSLPSAGELDTFLAVFPDITGQSFEINNDPPFSYPQNEKRDNSLDINITTLILGWDLPEAKWPQPVYEDNIKQDVSPENSDSVIYNPDEGGNPWERGFYALGHSSQSRFHLLFVVYWEGMRFIYGPPNLNQTYMYRLFSIGLKGERIDSLWLFSGEFEGENPGREYNGIAVLDSGLLLTKEMYYLNEAANDIPKPEILHYQIDKDGHINALE
jgi:hypothetical protein